MLAAPKMAHGAKSVATALARHLNFQTLRLDPSARRLGKLTGQSEGNVNKHLRTLKVRGFVEWDSLKGRVSNKYRLTFPTLSQRMASAGSNPILPGGVGTRPVETGLPPNPIRADRPTLSERNVQPYPGEQANLVLNHESNLPPDLRILFTGPEALEWREHLFRGLKFGEGRIIIFRNTKQMEFASHHYGDHFDRLGYTTRVGETA